MTVDERIEALTQSVELLASIHRENEIRAAKQAEQMNRLESALMVGIAEFVQELGRKDDDGEA